MSKQEVWKQFEQKRSILHKIGEKYSFTHPEVVKCSQELDVIHNKLQALMINRNQEDKG